MRKVSPQARHQHRMQAQGCCVRCSRPNDREGHTRCSFCGKRNAAQVRSRRAQLIAMGRCQECRKADASEGYTRCFGCRVKASERDKRYRKRTAYFATLSPSNS